MALMLGKLYDALKAANIPDEKARAAAEEVATYEEVRSDTRLLKWMVGVLIALVLGVFWMQWQTVASLGGIEARITGVEGRLAGVERELVDVKGQLTNVRERLIGVETAPEPPS